MNIKLKDLLRCINTNQEIQVINKDNGEGFFPMYGELQDFNEFYVIGISAYEDDRLTVCIKESI